MPRKLKKRVNCIAETVHRKPDGRYELKLFVTGITPRSREAVHNVKKICNEHLRGKVDLKIIDIYRNAKAAREEQIIATPTLIRKLPQPLRRFIGDLSDTENILLRLH